MDVINSLNRAAQAGNLNRVIDFIEDDLVDINSCTQSGLTALHSASREGHSRVVEELLARGANVNAKSKKGNTPLHLASLAGKESVVRILIENGADVNEQSVNGFTALYMAAQENHEGIVRLLLASGASQNISNTDGFTPLAVAMQQGHETIASILLANEAKGRIRFPGTTESGRSLLHVAARKDDLAAAGLLIRNNISPDTTSKSGFTALHVACHYGSENVARLLIERQADVNFQAKHNITPLHVAAKWNKDRMVMLLLENQARIDATTMDGLTPLHCAARSGHEVVVGELVIRNAPISAKTRSGLTPLHMATQGGHLSSAQILLANKAPVDDVTMDYLTALHVASHCGHVNVAELLLKSKADPNFRAMNGFTPLHIACKKNHQKIVELLLKYGASMNAVTESGLTPLHVASFMGCIDIVEYLLRNKANIEAVTVRGETSLHLATRANQIEVIKVLLRYGADVGSLAKESQSALHIASRLGNANIVKLLIQHGIDVDAATRDSYTALHIASKEGHEPVVEILLDNGANIACATRNHGFTPLHLASKYGVQGVVDLLLSYGAPVDAPGKNGVTPLHVATHYNYPIVVQMLLQDQGPNSPGASPHATAKNGYTPLHIAAKGNRLEIADALLQHGSNPNAQSKAGFCPIHLAAQEGQVDMAALLLTNRAAVNCPAKNGITPLHLCAQEDHVSVAQLLVKQGAHLDAQTKGGFTPLHVASHFARIRMIRFLLANGANVNIPTLSGYTPLHQASQQGNPQIVDLLLQYDATPDALTENGQTALSIAQNLGYVSIIDTLKVVTETIVKTTKMTITEEKYKIVAPESMQETFVSDSEDEAADDTKQHAETVKFLTTDVMKNFNSTTMTDDYRSSQSNLAAAATASGHLGASQRGASRASSQQHVLQDEMSQDLTYLAREAPLDGGESTFGAAASYSQLLELNDSANEAQRSPSPEETAEQLLISEQRHLEEAAELRWRQASEEERRKFMSANQQALEQLSPDNVDIWRPMQQAGFLVSFMVDARGGAMRGCRHSGVRVIIPANSAQQPMRITCRYLRRERLVHPPPLYEGEACASKIMEVGPAGARFLEPVLIEVPHFASLRGQEREIIVLRSDDGGRWYEHLAEPDDKLVEAIIKAAPKNPDLDEHDVELDENNKENNNKQLSGATTDRLTRIVTTEFPQYFAIISRIRRQVHKVGPEGLVVNYQGVPKVQANFTKGALTKSVKIGLQPANKNKSADSRTQQQVRQLTEQQQDEQQQQLEHTFVAHSQLAASNQNDEGSPQLGRPSSAAAKRRSRFLACFGAKNGSVDLLEDSLGDGASSGAGGDSPRHAHPLVSDDSDAAYRSSSPSPSSLAGNLVPDDYYLEEPPLILTLEPTTFGKRLANSSAQTDQTKLNTAILSTSARTPKRSRGLLGGRRRNKTQMTIHCESSADNSLADTNNNRSSPEPASLGAAAAFAAETTEQPRSVSLAEQEAPEDQQQADKWRSRTIQTDSDSVTVQYVTMDAQHASVASGADDGYVSGSGDLNKQHSSLGKGLFSCVTNEKRDSLDEGAQQLQSPAAAEVVAVKKVKSKHSGNDHQHIIDEEADEETRARSVSPSPGSKAELKQQAKLEARQRKERQKEEKRLQKEAEQAEKARKKLEREAEKEAKKAAKKTSSPAAESTAAPQTAATSTTTNNKRASVKFAPETRSLSGASLDSASASSGSADKASDKAKAKKKRQAAVVDDSSPAVVESPQADSSCDELAVAAGGLSSLEHVVQRTSAAYRDEKERLNQADGRDLIRVSISEKLADDEDEPAKRADDEAPLDECRVAAGQVEPAAAEPTRADSPGDEDTSTAAAELVIGEQRIKAPPLVVEASEEAVRAADALKLAEQSAATPTLGEQQQDDGDGSPLSAKERLKLEAKARAAEEKKAAQEAKRAAKEAESRRRAEQAAEKKAAREAKAEAERVAREAKAEAERLARAAKAEAKAEAERVAREAKAEAERLKKEAKRAAKSANKSADNSSSSDAPTTSRSTVTKAIDEVVELVADEQQSSQAEVVEQTEELTSSSPSASSKSKKNKKAKKVLKKGSTTTTADEELTSDSISEGPSKSFFGRLFGKKAATNVDSNASSDGAPPVEAKDEPDSRPPKPVALDQSMAILSEMYPSDPADADGEMILEVNVPEQLIAGHHQSQAAATKTTSVDDEEQADDDTLMLQASTTIDETFGQTDTPQRRVDELGEDTNEPETTLDEQATLVTSQTMGEFEQVDEEEATENQLIDLGGSTLGSPVREEVQQESSTEEAGVVVVDSSPVQVSSERHELDRSSAPPLAPAPSKVDESPSQVETAAAASSLSHSVLREEKSRLELEEKLEHEAKRRAKEDGDKRQVAKEEAKRLKELAKEEKRQKKLAEADAKKAAKEAKKKAKKDAEKAKLDIEKAKLDQEKAEKDTEKAKKEAAEQKKAEKKRKAAEEAQRKEEAKRNKLEKKKSKSESKKTDKKTAAAVVVVKDGEVVGEKGETLASGEASQPKAEATTSGHLEAGLDSLGEELEGMTPVQTETEVCQFVEETVDDEGVVTKTTKTIETKYVTLRSEELRQGEHREMPVEEYERQVASGELEKARVKTETHQRQLEAELDEHYDASVVQTSAGQHVAYEHPELDEIRSQPSAFGPQGGVSAEEFDKNPKRALAKQVKLNKRLVKRALKLASCEAKRAKREEAKARSEIVVCDEANKEARKQLKRALKEAKKAAKLAAKEHKKMDKVDKKLAKRQKKIDKKQRKLDKRAAKLAAKEAKRRAKADTKEAKLERKSTGGSRRSIKLEDIGQPVLRSSSRHSLGSSGHLEAAITTLPIDEPQPSDNIQAAIGQVSEPELTGQQQEALQKVELSLERDEEEDVVGELPDVPRKHLSNSASVLHQQQQLVETTLRDEQQNDEQVELASG